MKEIEIEIEKEQTVNPILKKVFESVISLVKDDEPQEFCEKIGENEDFEEFEIT